MLLGADDCVRALSSSADLVEGCLAPPNLSAEHQRIALQLMCLGAKYPSDFRGGSRAAPLQAECYRDGVGAERARRAGLVWGRDDRRRRLETMKFVLALVWPNGLARHQCPWILPAKEPDDNLIINLPDVPRRWTCRILEMTLAAPIWEGNAQKIERSDISLEDQRCPVYPGRISRSRGQRAVTTIFFEVTLAVKTYQLVRDMEAVPYSASFVLTPRFESYERDLLTQVAWYPPRCYYVV